MWEPRLTRWREREGRVGPAVSPMGIKLGLCLAGHGCEGHEGQCLGDNE